MPDPMSEDELQSAIYLNRCELGKELHRLRTQLAAAEEACEATARYLELCAEASPDDELLCEGYKALKASHEAWQALRGGTNDENANR